MYYRDFVTITTVILTGQGGGNEENEGQVCQPADVSKETISMGDCEEHCHVGPRFDGFSKAAFIIILLMLEFVLVIY